MVGTSRSTVLSSLTFVAMSHCPQESLLAPSEQLFFSPSACIATMEKRLDGGLFMASDITYDESLLHSTKSSAADARDMARMGKPQEMKVQLALLCSMTLSKLTSICIA